MASIIDKAKKLANKISDEVNKGKWDSNCVNTALFNNEDPYKAVPAPEPFTSGERPRVRDEVVAAQQQNAPTQAAAAPTPPGDGYVKPVFYSRFSGPGGYKTSKAPGSSGLRSLSDLPVVDRSQAISSIGPVTANNLLQEQQAAVQEAAVPQTVQQSVGQETATPPAQAAQSVEKTDAAAQRCYYVLITHTKSYPAPGSQVLMRSCDHGYAWTNSMTEDQKPEVKFCPCCGKQVGYTETKID